MKNLWTKLFLEERPTISLAFFRIPVALTVGLHVIPSLCHLDENYFHAAYKSFNFSFFPPWAIELVQRSSDGVVVFFVAFFLLSWFFFLIGWFTQISCILMTLACYYFYALNALHVGTLSWDILLVTMFLMCLTPYPGDYFSVDCLRRGDVLAYRRRRPFFLQRLLQLQIASTFFYTALYKITGEGNWLTGNPIYYLMNYPPSGVTKHFLAREFLMNKPGLDHFIGVFIVVCELSLPFLLFIPKTRRSAIVLGIIFHVFLILTFDVPAIFFFLFPAQLLLFIHPDRLIRKIEEKRANASQGVQSILIYDGNCGFCSRAVLCLLIMDLFNALKIVDYNRMKDIGNLHPDLTRSKVMSRIYLIEPDGNLSAGYFVFRRLCFKLPMMAAVIPVFYFPGSGLLGPLIYRWVAEHRYLLHGNKICRNNNCFRPPS